VNASQKKITGSNQTVVARASAGDEVWSEPWSEITKPIKSNTTSAEGTTVTGHQRPHTIHNR
jgi:hypothetical protein